jgi:cation diffusion facilitator CzcD-associated flavoprotein CzcO
MSSIYGHIGIEKEPRMLYLDAFRAHLTPKVRATIKENWTTLSIVLGGYIEYIQVLNVSLNKPLKDLIKEEHDDHFDRHVEEWEQEKFNVGERRVLLTHWVAKAWKRLHLEYKETIIKTFQHVGLSLNPDGSEDDKLKIRELLGITVGDFSRGDVFDQQEDNDEAIVLAEAEAAREEVEEEEDHERNWQAL